MVPKYRAANHGSKDNNSISSTSRVFEDDVERGGLVKEVRLAWQKPRSCVTWLFDERKSVIYIYDGKHRCGVRKSLLAQLVLWKLRSNSQILLIGCMSRGVE